MLVKKIPQLLKPLASGKMVFLWFLLAHAVLLCMMTFTFPKINTRLGTEAFDLKPLGYSVTEATQMLEHLDASTVKLYLMPQLFLFDILYPLLLALFLSTLTLRLANLTGKQYHTVVFSGIILPFLAMIFDYTENILIALMITDPGNASPELIRSASTFTILKGVCTTLSWLVMLTLGFLWLYCLVRSRQRQPL